MPAETAQGGAVVSDFAVCRGAVLSYYTVCGVTMGKSWVVPLWESGTTYMLVGAGARAGVVNVPMPSPCPPHNALLCPGPIMPSSALAHILPAGSAHCPRLSPTPTPTPMPMSTQFAWGRCATVHTPPPVLLSSALAPPLFSPPTHPLTSTPTFQLHTPS